MFPFMRKAMMTRKRKPQSATRAVGKQAKFQNGRSPKACTVAAKSTSPVRKSPRTASAESKPSARDKLLQAAVHVVRQKGYAATSVDDLCKAAGVTKGAFFHHFASKEDLGVAAAQYWNDFTTEFFKSAPYQ